MAVEIIDTLQQKNDGDFPIVMAEDVGLDDGTSLADKLKELEENSGTGDESTTDFVAIFESALSSAE